MTDPDLTARALADAAYMRELHERLDDEDELRWLVDDPVKAWGLRAREAVMAAVARADKAVPHD